MIKPNKLRLHCSSVTSYCECLHFKEPHFTKYIWPALTTIINSFGSRKQQKIIFIHGLWHSVSWHSFLDYEQTIWTPKRRRYLACNWGWVLQVKSKAIGIRWYLQDLKAIMHCTQLFLLKKSPGHFMICTAFSEYCASFEPIWKRFTNSGWNQQQFGGKKIPPNPTHHLNKFQSDFF